MFDVEAGGRKGEEAEVADVNVDVEDTNHEGIH